MSRDRCILGFLLKIAPFLLLVAESISIKLEFLRLSVIELLAMFPELLHYLRLLLMISFLAYSVSRNIYPPKVFWQFLQKLRILK